MRAEEAERAEDETEQHQVDPVQHGAASRIPVIRVRVEIQEVALAPG